MESMIPLIDERGVVYDYAEKMEVHQKGLLHLAFSVLIYDREGRMLIHRRADEKYHSGGLWTNACCGHPYPHEAILAAAERRLEEEMGIRTALRSSFRFHYTADMENGLIENELDQVFEGQYEGPIHPNPAEVAEYRWVALPDLHQEIAAKPETFTFWFKTILAHQNGGHRQ
jgi:isopentenyl-diphosphate delta-isomerase type 1